MLSFLSRWLAPKTRVHQGLGLHRGRRGCRRLVLEMLEDRTLLSWSTVAPLTTAREFLAATAGPDGRIYAIGGAVGNFSSFLHALNTVEAYNPSTNSWSTVAPMPTARENLAAATGSDGRIYAIGGAVQDSNGNTHALTTVEAYNPSTNSWSTVASLPAPQAFLAAATGSDGRIYAIGGAVQDSNGNIHALNTVEAYNPSTNSWSTVANLPTARANLAATTGPDGRAYAIGGDDSNGNVFTTVEAYNPSTNSWSTVASLPTARTDLAATRGPDGRIYAIDGAFSGDVQAYDPNTNAWSNVAPTTSPHDGLGAATGSDGRIYAIGGDNVSGDLSTVEAFSPSPYSWTTVASVPTRRDGLGVATGSDGRIYAIGGIPIDSNVFQSVNTVEAYNSSTNSWSTVASMPTARTDLAVATGSDGRTYAIGGDVKESDGFFHALNTVEAYNPSTNSWSTVAPMPTARARLAVATGLNGLIYAIGGDDDNGNELTTVEAYNSSTNSWSTVASLPAPENLLAAATGPDGRIYIFHQAHSEAYNPSTNSWSTVASMPTKRFDLAATTGPDGRIYVIGGSDNVDNLNTVEVYNSSTNSWSEQDGMPTGRERLRVATGPDGHIYAIGGFKTCGDPTNTVIYFNIVEALTITSPGVMVTPPSNQSAVEAAGQSFNLGSFSDGGSGSWTASVAWGDGTSMMLPAPSGPGSLGSSSHMYAEEGTYTVTVTVTDTGDQQSGTGMFQVTVSDPAVSASPSVGFNAMEGSAVSNQQLATFVDPAGAEALASYSASINWGDGTAATTGGISFSGSAFTITGSHTYAEEGSYTVTVTINHETSTTQTVTSTATVSDPAVAANGIGVNAVLSTSFTSAVATFTDPGSLEVLGDYSATINWGDSTPATTGTLALTNGIVTVSGSHAYTSTGSFTVTTTIHHDTATPTTVTSTAMVGNAPPPVVTAAGNQTATEAGSKSFTIGSFQDAGAGPDSGSINWGDGTTATSLGTVTPGTLSNQTHTYAEEGSYTVTITITDAATSQSGTGMFVVSVSDPSVTATGGVSVTAQEGAPSTSQAVATFTDPGIAEANDGTHYSASINWGDNTAATAGSISFSGTTFTVSGSHAYAEEGSYTLTVTINHENSAAQTVTSTATVSNANVAASGGLSFNGTEGTGLGTQTVATFTDPGGAEPIADYSATINWGDGTTATAGTITVTGTTFSITGSHSYGEEGTYTLSVTVNHETSTSQTITDTATISDVAVAATGVPVNAGVNSSSTVSVATFTDPGGTEPADGTHYSASITWGDNTPASVGTITLTNGVYTVMGTHTYTTIASFTITTTINHEGATPQTVMSTASVAMGIPPSVTAPGSQTSAEGMAQSFSLGSFTDPDGGPWTVDVAWGDGSAHTTVPGNTPGSLGSQPHTYAEEGSYTVTVTVKDTFDGQTGSGMFSVSVSNPSVVATGGLTFNASENTASATQPVATFTDPGGAEGLADYSATINWGDNTPPTTGTITQNGTTFTVSGSHTYTEEGSAPITVTINHEGITPATATSTAAVADVSVIATGGFSFSGTEGVLATTQTVATFTDPAGAEPNDGTHYTATINWGDGSTPSTGTISFAGGTFTVSGNHTYAEEGSATLTVTINHEGSTAQTATTTATISNPNIVASGGFSVSGSEGAGSSMQTVATFTDPGGAEGVADYNATIAWGDGTTPTAGTITVAGTTFSVLGSHTYGEEGSYPVTVAISHEASTAPMAISMATVSDPAVVGTPVNILFNPSVAFNGAVATFTDPGGAEANDGTHYSASIAWGDNTPTTAGTITFGNGKFTVSGTHTYGSGSTFPTTILLFHEGATPAMVNGTATIASTGQPVPPQMTKPISFWASIVGQELIKRFGLTAGGQTLGQWLATTLPNLYGGNNSSPNLSSFTNSQLAIFYLGLFNKQNTLKLDAEVMATALEVFTTTMSLGGTLGQQYGFLVNNFGLGAYTWNIGFNGPAFGVPNSTVETVFQILTATNSFAQGGEPWGSNTTLRNEGYSVFSGINGG